MQFRMSTRITSAGNILLALVCLFASSPSVGAFLPLATFRNGASLERGTALNAIGVLARKAKEASLRKYAEAGIEDDVRAKVEEMKAALQSEGTTGESLQAWMAGPLQQALTKRKGTITVIAEYKRKLENSAIIDFDKFNPEILSPVFREFGASAVAVMADEAMGGATYDDVRDFANEQEGAKGDMPGPLPVISNDLIVDELQLAQSAAAGVSAVVVTMSAVGPERCAELKRCANALGLETIVAVSSAEEARDAVSSEIGATIISVVGLDGFEAKCEVIAGLEISDDDSKKVCTIANILAKDNKALEEVEEAWILRDRGFNAVWVSDALYKSGADPTEHPGAIINSMKAKSSVKWASPKARSGKGEGAREYLGDIMM